MDAIILAFGPWALGLGLFIGLQIVWALIQLRR